MPLGGSADIADVVRPNKNVGDSDSHADIDRGTRRNNIIIQSNGWYWLTSGAGERQKLSFGMVEMETVMKNPI